VEKDEEYVRRRRWTWDEKRSVVEEAAASGNVIGTAKRHGIQAHQIYRWRDRLFGQIAAAEFAAVSVVADPPIALPAPVPDPDHPDERPVSDTRADDRIEIVSGCGVTIRLPAGSSSAFVVAIATGMSRRR